MLLLSLAGCRAPSIPAEPSAREYAVWHDVLAFEASITRPQTLIISPDTLPLDEAQLQFQRCLPRHMRDIFDEASTASVSANVSEDWLHLPDGQLALLGGRSAARPSGKTTFLRFSRVAFSFFRRDGFVWVERQSCTAAAGGPLCEEREGKLLHIVRDSDRWSIEETDCDAAALAGTD